MCNPPLNIASTKACMCMCVSVHLYTAHLHTCTAYQHQSKPDLYVLFIVSAHFCVCLHACVCVCELLCLYIPCPPEPWIISFTLTCPADELKNQLRLTSYLFDMAASQHQRLDETRAAALRGSCLTLCLPPSLLYCSFSGQVNLFHMTAKRGLLQTLTAQIHPEKKNSVLSRRHNHIPLITHIWSLYCLSGKVFSFFFNWKIPFICYFLCGIDESVDITHVFK